MSGAGLHKAGLSDLGGLGLRKLAGCLHPSAGDQLDRWEFVLSAPSWGPAHRPIPQTCAENPPGFVPGGAETGRSIPGHLAPSGPLGLSYDLEPGPATGSQALPVWLEEGGWILACPPLPECPVLFWLGLGCFALQMPLSRRLPPSLKDARSSFAYVFFPVLQVQLSSSLPRVTEFPSCTH